MTTDWPIPAGGYSVGLADPAWQSDVWSDLGKNRSPEAHYETMPTPDICALYDKLNLGWIFAPDSVLVLWGTWPMMARGDVHQVMRAWGFTPKTGGSWTKITKSRKPHMGTGKIYRGASEPWLLGTRGAPKLRNKSTMNAILDRRRRHSEKPEQMYSDIEALFDGPYLELFARKQRPGWTAWGDQVGLLDDGASSSCKRIFTRPPQAPGPLLVAMESA